MKPTLIRDLTTNAWMKFDRAKGDFGDTGVYDHEKNQKPFQFTLSG